MRNKIEKIINTNIKKITTSYNGNSYDVTISFDVNDLFTIKSLFNLNDHDKEKMKFRQAFEPKRINRCFVEFPKQFNIESWSVKKINSPKFINNKWEDIKINFINSNELFTFQGLFEIVNFLKNNKSNNEILFEIKIKLLDPTGMVTEEWIVYVEKVVSINFGEYDYSSNEIQESYLIVKPQCCILKY